MPLPASGPDPESRLNPGSSPVYYFLRQDLRWKKKSQMVIIISAKLANQEAPRICVSPQTPTTGVPGMYHLHNFYMGAGVHV